MAPKRPVPLGWVLRESKHWNKLFYQNLLSGDIQLEKPRGPASLATDEQFSLTDEGPVRKRLWKKRPANRRAPKKPNHVAVRHVLIKHHKSEHTTQCRLIDGKSANRSKKMAFDFAKDVRRDIISKKIAFQDAALDYSECRSAFKGGMLDPIFKRDDSDKDIKKTGFSLIIGEISEPIETSRGFHIIERVA